MISSSNIADLGRRGQKEAVLGAIGSSFLALVRGYWAPRSKATLGSSGMKWVLVLSGRLEGEEDDDLVPAVIYK